MTVSELLLINQDRQAASIGKAKSHVHFRRSLKGWKRFADMEQVGIERRKFEAGDVGQAGRDKGLAVQEDRLEFTTGRRLLARHGNIKRVESALNINGKQHVREGTSFDVRRAGGQTGELNADQIIGRVTNIRRGGTCIETTIKSRAG